MNFGLSYGTAAQLAQLSKFQKATTCIYENKQPNEAELKMALDWHWIENRIESAKENRNDTETWSSFLIYLKSLIIITYT